MKFFGISDKKRKHQDVGQTADSYHARLHGMEMLELCQELVSPQQVKASMVNEYFQSKGSKVDATLQVMMGFKEQNLVFESWKDLCRRVEVKLDPSLAGAQQPDEEMSWEQLTNLYPEVGKVLAYMSENPDLFERDEIAVTVRSLYNLVKLADSTADVLKFLKKYVKQEKQFTSFDTLTDAIRASAEKHRAKQLARKEEKKKKKKNKKKKENGEPFDEAEEQARELERAKMEQMEKAMAKLGKMRNGVAAMQSQSPQQQHNYQQKKNFQMLPQIAPSHSPVSGHTPSPDHRRGQDRRSYGGSHRTGGLP
jgi:hypothetical protein